MTRIFCYSIRIAFHFKCDANEKLECLFWSQDFVAQVQHALLKSDRALETLNAALSMSPKNAICKFERASILFAMENYPEALKELKELKDLVPKESPVYFLLGKVTHGTVVLL